MFDILHAKYGCFRIITGITVILPILGISLSSLSFFFFFSISSYIYIYIFLSLSLSLSITVILPIIGISQIIYVCKEFLNANKSSKSEGVNLFCPIIFTQKLFLLIYIYQLLLLLLFIILSFLSYYYYFG